jgi:hypothetical protein
MNRIQTHIQVLDYSLTFKKALKLAVAMETAMKDSLELRGKAKTIPPVNSIREVPMQHKCYRCGECYFRNAILKINIVETVGKRAI